MKPITNEWLKSAKNDLDTIEAIISKTELTGVVSFHSQQCIEKVLKAIIEEFEISMIKTHDLIKLIGLVPTDCPIQFDEDKMTLLNKLYIESRYPGELGLLPDGKPSPQTAKDFYEYAKKIHNEAKNWLSSLN